jgi:lysophospholipase L1-like esterase
VARKRQRRRSLGQAETLQPQAAPRRRTWLWVLAGTLGAAGVALLIRNLVLKRERAQVAETDISPVESPTAPEPEAPIPPPAPGKVRVVVLGDSITVGYLPRLKKILAGTDVIGEGFGGRMVDYIHSHGQKYLDQSPTHVVILAGINNIASYDAGYRATDSKKQVHNVSKALQRLWSDAKKTGAKVYALTLLPCPSHRLCKRPEIAAEREKLNQFIRDSQGTWGGPDVVIDTEGFPTALLAGDGLHPSGSGQQALAQMVAQALQ